MERRRNFGRTQNDSARLTLHSVAEPTAWGVRPSMLLASMSVQLLLDVCFPDCGFASHLL